MSIYEAVLVILFTLFLVYGAWFIFVAPNRLAKARPYKVYGHDGYGPDRNGFNCAIVAVERHGKRYYRISWKAANGFWQPDYKPLPGHNKVILFKSEKDAAEFITINKGQLLERDAFYKAVQQKEDEAYEVR